jgi:predicted amidohydrolase YtcJ
LRAAGARITLSSDWDVSDLNPFIGLQNAVTRAPQELTLEEAVKAYTINAAYTMRQEDKVGSIEVGKEAVLIILDKNIFEIPATQINTTKIKKTYSKGKVVFE